MFQENLKTVHLLVLVTLVMKSNMALRSLAPPGKPTNVRSTSITNTSIVLTWTAPAAGDRTIKDYTIKYQAEGNQGSSLMKVAVQTTATLSHLKPFTVYVITVRASNAHGTAGVESDAVRIITKESAPGSVPSLTMTSNKPFSLAVSWTPIPMDKWNGAPGGYKLRYYQDGSQATYETVSENSTSYNINNLEPNKYYYVEIAGYNSAGLGPWKKSSQTKVKEGAPSDPRNVQVVKVDKKSVNLAWNKPEKANGVLRNYRVYYGLSKPVTKSLVLPINSYSGEKVSYTLKNLEEFQTYYVGISASTSLEGGRSPLQNFTTLEDVPNGQPSIKKDDSDKLDAHRIKIKWTSVPKLQRNGIIISYTVYYKKNHCSSPEPYSEEKIENGNTHETVIAGLKPFTWYGFKMKASTRIGIDKTPLDRIKPCVFIRTGQADPKKPVHVEPKSSFKIIAIVFICIASVFAVIVAIFGVTWFKKRKEKKRKMERNKTQDINLQVRMTTQQTENALPGGENMEGSNVENLGNYASLNRLPSGGTNHNTRNPESHTYAKLYKAEPLRMGGGTNTADFYEEVASPNKELIKPSQSPNYEII